jgi:serine/tyrosine/threonine adenylyltransferase
VPEPVGDELLRLTLKLLWESKAGYHDFFMRLREEFAPSWRENEGEIFEQVGGTSSEGDSSFEQWRSLYHQVLNSLPPDEMGARSSRYPQGVAHRLAQHNPTTVLIRPEIEAVWQAIAQEDNWQPFQDLLSRIKRSVVEQ